jgi:YXWGXW repeat-containing protein
LLNGSHLLIEHLMDDVLHEKGQLQAWTGFPIAAIVCMTRFLKALAISALLLVPASHASAQVTFGIRIGQAPPPPRYYRVPVQPGPDYEWVEGYWYPQGGRYAWRDGYWTRPPYAGAYWAAPYYSNGRYFSGRWEGNRGRRNDRSDRNREHNQRRDNSRRRY